MQFTQKSRSTLKNRIHLVYMGHLTVALRLTGDVILMRHDS